MRAVTIAVLAALLLTAAAWGLRIAMLFWFRPEPLEFGTIQRAYAFETGFTVDRVYRTRSIQVGRRVVRARGEFYVVDARVLCPFGDRYVWNDDRVHVETFSGLNGRMRNRHFRFAVASDAQHVVDAQDGRPGSAHLVLGRSRRERLVFDLPLDIEQPALVFDDANDPSNLPALLFGQPWQPARFNIRED